jgi:hypothetical protein
MLRNAVKVDSAEELTVSRTPHGVPTLIDVDRLITEALSSNARICRDLRCVVDGVPQSWSYL